MKKFIPIVLAMFMLFCGCAVPKTESISSGISITPRSEAASSLPTVTSVPSSAITSVISSATSTISQEPSELTTVSEGIGEPMTQAEFDDFFENVLPEVMILIGGQQKNDANNFITVNGVIYNKVTDDKYNTVEKLKSEFKKYFTIEFIDQNFAFYFNHKMPYKEKDGFIYSYDKTIGTTREFDEKRLFYRDSEFNEDIIDLHTIQNGTDPFLSYYFGLERVDGDWKINHAQCDVLPADAVLTPRMAKPVIYLYPEKVTDVTVKLDINGTLGCAYPAYPKDGWKVTAYPGGKLIVDGEEYNYLFWEGDLYTVFTFDKGFCVKGEDTAAFLKKALSEMGLIPSEYNDFIVYWLPKMEGNAYNLISFVGKEYTDNAKLNITPKPDSVLRVAMAYKPLEKPVEIEPQIFERFERKGFTVVEWGGAEVD